MANRTGAEQVAETYYDSTDADAFYERVWGGEDIHIGLYEPDTSIFEASRKTVETMAQALQDLLGVAGQLRESVVARLLRGEVDQLDLVELVLADQAADVLAVGAGLAAEAGGVGGVAARQIRLLERLPAVQVGQRHLGGGHQVVVGPLELEQVGLELGELSRSDQRVGVDDERRQHLGVAVRARVEVEHELDERPLEPGAGPEVGGEAGAGHLGAALEVEDAEIGPQVPVRLGGEVEPARLADARATM